MEQAPEPEPVVVAFPAVRRSAPRIDGEEVAALVGARLRVLRRTCATMLIGVALLLPIAVMMVQLGPRRAVSPATGLSLTLTALAAVLILAASRLQAAILSRAGRGAGVLPAAAAQVVGAYVGATIAGFACLAAAAALGLVVAASTGNVRYALVICGGAALAMLARWPRRAAVLRLLRLRGLA